MIYHIDSIMFSYQTVCMNDYVILQELTMHIIPQMTLARALTAKLITGNEHRTLRTACSLVGQTEHYTAYPEYNSMRFVSNLLFFAWREYTYILSRYFEQIRSQGRVSFVPATYIPKAKEN